MVHNPSLFCLVQEHMKKKRPSVKKNLLHTLTSDILRIVTAQQVGGLSISLLQSVLVISGTCRFWVSTHWLLQVTRDGNKEVARVQLRAWIQKQEKGPGTPLPESLSGFPSQDPSVVFVFFLGAFKSSGCTLAKTDSRRYSGTEKWSYQTITLFLTTCSPTYNSSLSVLPSHLYSGMFSFCSVEYSGNRVCPLGS